LAGLQDIFTLYLPPSVNFSIGSEVVVVEVVEVALGGLGS
jgi:hypothetical protein